MDYAISQLQRYHPLTEEFIRDLKSRLRRLEPAKNNTLLVPGDICRDLYLIEKGMLACYDTDPSGKYCTWIMTKGDFVTSVNSFNNQVPSTETIIAIKNSRLYAITKLDLDELTDKHACFRAIRQILTDFYHLQSRLMESQGKRPPELYYEYLLATYPDIVNEAPVTALASLMGITRTTLYEIIRRRNSPGKR